MSTRPDNSPWDFQNPFVHSLKVSPDTIDRLGHVNNAAYLQFLEAAAWAHAEALGAGWDLYQQLGTVVVAHRHEIDYLKPAFAGEALQVGTWCTGIDGRLRFRRHYQIRRPADDSTLVRAVTHWISVDLVSGRPRRMPAEFMAAYQPISSAPPYP